MKKISVFAAVLAVAAGPAFANNVPVPSFNDIPELYTHPTLGEARSASEGRSAQPLRDVNQGANGDYAPKQHGPEVTPSSGE
jgi:hypothetical protein